MTPRGAFYSSNNVKDSSILTLSPLLSLFSSYNESVVYDKNVCVSMLEKDGRKGGLIRRSTINGMVRKASNLQKHVADALYGIRKTRLV
jgi:hypothetical protein